MNVEPTRWCVRANQHHHGESDSDVDDDPANDYN